MQPAVIEVWTDGSVGKIRQEFIHRLIDGEQVSVKWNGRLYTASLKNFSDSPYRNHHAVKKIEDQHSKVPDIILMYDDGDEHPYSAHPISSTQHVIICDEDGETLGMYRTISSQVGGAGVLMLRRGESIAELALTAETVGSSFDAECFVEFIWIPSHCGLPKNDAAEELARSGILESNLLAQQAVPLAMESAQSVIKPTMQTNFIRVPSLPDELNISNRRAEDAHGELPRTCCKLSPQGVRG